MRRHRRVGWVVIGLCLLAAGCREGARECGLTVGAPAAQTAEVLAEGRLVSAGPNVWVEMRPDGRRRVVVAAEVCLREGPLEHLLTRKDKKEHEAVLVADMDARQVHNALLLADAAPGAPVSLSPVFRPARGAPIRVLVAYRTAGRVVRENARSWLRSVRSGRELGTDWVFAGSGLAEGPHDPASVRTYLANEGDVISVANFETAMLDLPIGSSNAGELAGFVAWTERIPPEGTRVTVILEPLLPKAP